MTTTEQSSFTRMLAACQHAAQSFHHPHCKCKGEYLANPEQYCTCHVQKARAALEAARADRALYEAARAMEKALETIALESALDDYATIRNIACAALPKE